MPNEVYKPLLGGNVWAPRIGLMVIAGVCGVGTRFEDHRGMQLLFATAVFSLVTFEICVAVFRCVRRRIWTTGVSCTGRILSKWIAPRGGLYKLTIAYEWEQRELQSTGYVSAKTFFDLRIGELISIRILPENPGRWVPGDQRCTAPS